MRKPLIALGALALFALPFMSEPAKAQSTRVYSSCAAAAWSPLDLGRPLSLLPDGRLCVNATVSASINGFTPNGDTLDYDLPVMGVTADKARAMMGKKN